MKMRIWRNRLIRKLEKFKYKDDQGNQEDEKDRDHSQEDEKTDQEDDNQEEDLRMENLPETQPETTTNLGIGTGNSNGTSGANRVPITINNSHRKIIGISRKGVMLKYEDHTKLTVTRKGRGVVGGGKLSKLTHSGADLRPDKLDGTNNGRAGQNRDF